MERCEVFAYCRVSALESTQHEQLEEIERAGYKIAPQCVVEERINGSVSALSRPLFAHLVNTLSPNEVLVVARLDALGRDVIDIQKTIDLLSSKKVGVICLPLGNFDLTMTSGMKVLEVLKAVANFEKDLLVERTQLGLAKAKADVHRLGRHPSLTNEQREKVWEALSDGCTLASLAEQYGVSRQTIGRVREFYMKKTKVEKE